MNDLQPKLRAVTPLQFAAGSTTTEEHAVAIGRYLLHRQIARGGMATIHIARLLGDQGFSRIVAAKRLLPEFAEDEEFVAMFLDEARIASKVHHRNVVPVLDLVTSGRDVILVQEYVHGVPLHVLLRAAHQAGVHVPIHIAVGIACQVLAGLHAAHDTVDELGAPLHIVHRDVSPQNVMVAVDGTARLLDFGVAKATMAAHVTREGVFKGKLAYSSPEQLHGHATQQSDIYALGIVLWELLVGRRMHQDAQSEAELIAQILAGRLPTLAQALAGERAELGEPRWRQLELLDAILKKAFALDPIDRWNTAAELEQVLSHTVAPAPASSISAWLRSLGRDFLEGRDKVLAAEEASWRRLGAPESGTAAAAAIALPVPTPRPPAPARRSTALFAASCAALGALAVAALIALRASPPARAAAPPPSPALVAPAAPAAPPAATAASPIAAAPARVVGAPAPAPPAPAPKPAAITAAPPPAAPAHPAERARDRDREVTHTASRSHASSSSSSSSHAHAAPKPAPAPTEVATPAAAAVEKPDCNPPYYYEGKKKVFKLSCL